jgi:hypothetical protein
MEEASELKCKICSKEALSNDYCMLHEKAYQILMGKFETWKRALDLSWKDYLNEIVKHPLTGTKAREVAEALLSKQNKTG